MKIRLEMKNYNIILIERLQKALPSGKIDKYKYLSGEDILPYDQQQIIEQVKFIYSPLGKAFEKKRTIEDQRKKQIDALADLKPKEIKSRNTKTGEYSDYFLNGLAIIRKSFKPVNFYDLIFKFKNSNIHLENFIDFKGPNAIFKDIHDGDKVLEHVENEQKKLKHN